MPFQLSFNFRQTFLNKEERRDFNEVKRGKAEAQGAKRGSPGDGEDWAEGTDLIVCGLLAVGLRMPLRAFQRRARSRALSASQIKFTAMPVGGSGMWT